MNGRPRQCSGIAWSVGSNNQTTNQTFSNKRKSNFLISAFNVKPSPLWTSGDIIAQKLNRDGHINSATTSEGPRMGNLCSVALPLKTFPSTLMTRSMIEYTQVTWMNTASSTFEKLYTIQEETVNLIDTLMAHLTFISSTIRAQSLLCAPSIKCNADTHLWHNRCNYHYWKIGGVERHQFSCGWMVCAYVERKFTSQLSHVTHSIFYIIPCKWTLSEVSSCRWWHCC